MPRPRADEPRLDRTRIVNAAVELVNERGADGLSIHTLARILKVRPPSLYNHVGGLHQIQEELARVNATQLASTFAEAAIGKSGADGIRSISRAYREYILRNHGLYSATLRASGTRAEPDPELQQMEARTVGVVLAVLAPYGLDESDALHAVRAVRSNVHGFATLESAGGFGLALDTDETFTRLLAMLVDELERGGFVARANR